MFITLKFKHFLLFTLIISSSFIMLSKVYIPFKEANSINEAKADKDFIKWVDFGASYSALRDTLNLDIKTSTDKNAHIPMVNSLSFLAARNGGNFKNYKKSDLDVLIKGLSNGKTMNDLTENLKFYNYYQNAYSAILSEYVGYYGKESAIGGDMQTKEWLEYYGLKVFSPIADGFGYSHYDDFGSSRTYGYARKHLGHDIMGSIGTPIIAVESGTVEALGWNQYGGWRIGIRSFDKKRYYYYAHLRKDHPYQSGLKEGMSVNAGDVIGYLGMTGYSAKENVNNIDTPHLHFGVQLIFDESQKDGNGEIWIDCYALTNLLSQNRAEVYYDKEKKEYYRKYNYYELENRSDI